MAVWNHYCKLSTPELILSGLFSRKRDEPWSKPIDIENHPWNQLGPNPLAPGDSYPERMVVCQWVQDRRRRVFLDQSIVSVAPPISNFASDGMTGGNHVMPP